MRMSMAARRRVDGGAVAGVAASRLMAAGLAMAMPIVAAGCGGPAKRAVAGRVTIDDQPLDEAVIMFVPLDLATSKTGAKVLAGRYDVGRDVGLLPGRYRVEIADDPPIELAMRPGASQPRPRRRLPIAYSIASPLAVEITAGGETEFDFNLTSQPAAAP
jgi:hypothetical protein